MKALGMYSNSLNIHVHCTFPMYYFNIKKVYLIDIGKRKKVGKRKKE
jgi:hypothetical protein